MNAWSLQTRPTSSRKWNKSFRENKGGFSAAPTSKDLWCRLTDRDLKGRRDGYGNRVDTPHGIRFRNRSVGTDEVRAMFAIDFVMSRDCKDMTMQERRDFCSELRQCLNSMKMNASDKLAVICWMHKRKLHHWFQSRAHQAQWNQWSREQREDWKAKLFMELTIRVEDLGICDYEPRETVLRHRGEVCDAKQRMGL